VTSKYNPVPTPTVFLNTLSDEQIDSYVSMVRMAEIDDILNTESYINEAENAASLDGRFRSPSPAPIYDGQGRRTNTRAERYRKKYEDERYALVERLMKLIPTYKTPEWYAPKPKVIVEKLFVKATEYPHINFVGLLIGPRGNTLKKLQQDSGAKVGIRGKGSVRESRSTMPNAPELEHLREPLHCLITADTQEKVDKAKKLCQEVIDKAIYSPEGGNDLKREQLKELAVLNGTYRDLNDRACLSCGEQGHTKAECPTRSRRPNFTNSLVCSKCGNVGHLEKDCKVEAKVNEHMDKEFEDFMNELNADSDVENEPSTAITDSAATAAAHTIKLPPPPPPTSKVPPPPPPGAPSTTTRPSGPPPPPPAKKSVPPPPTGDGARTETVVNGAVKRPPPPPPPSSSTTSAQATESHKRHQPVHVSAASAATTASMGYGNQYHQYQHQQYPASSQYSQYPTYPSQEYPSHYMGTSTSAPSAAPTQSAYPPASEYGSEGYAYGSYEGYGGYSEESTYYGSNDASHASYGGSHRGGRGGRGGGYSRGGYGRGGSWYGRGGYGR
jgi:splicing factor 1